MATSAQIAANRQNAQKSTGPRTPEGKTASSQNAFQSGLDADSQFCYGEQRADFYRLQAEYFTRFSPQSPEERFHVDTLLRNEWSLRRLFRAEAHLWEFNTTHASCRDGSPLPPNRNWSLRRLFRAEAHLWEFNTTHASCRDGSPLGEGFHNSSPVFIRLHRRITLFEKSYEASLTKIQTLQEARLAAPEPPARATEEELTYPGPTIYTFGPDLTPPPAPEFGFLPDVGQALPPALPPANLGPGVHVGQAPAPAPDPLVRPSESSTEPAEPASTNPKIGFVPPISHQPSNIAPVDSPSFRRPSQFKPRT